MIPEMMTQSLALLGAVTIYYMIGLVLVVWLYFLWKDEFNFKKEYGFPFLAPLLLILIFITLFVNLIRVFKLPDQVSDLKKRVTKLEKKKRK